MSMLEAMVSSPFHVLSEKFLCQLNNHTDVNLVLTKKYACWTKIIFLPGPHLIDKTYQLVRIW